MNIEEIKEFIKNKDAWYQISVSDDMSNDEIMRIKRIFDGSQIDGIFVITRHNIKIRDITEYMQKHRLKDVEV